VPRVRTYKTTKNRDGSRTVRSSGPYASVVEDAIKATGIALLVFGPMALVFGALYPRTPRALAWFVAVLVELLWLALLIAIWRERRRTRPS